MFEKKPGRRRSPVLLSAALVALLLAWPVVQARPRQPPKPPDLPSEHVDPSGAFSFRTPADWTTGPVAGRPDMLQSTGPGLLVRFIYRPQELGLDSAHASCMVERLAPLMDVAAEAKYEYDFVGGQFGELRALDSAFSTTYDRPILGQREWRQRNLTVVGQGQTLCIITFAPAQLWKKSGSTRELMDAIVRSVILLKPR